VRCQQAAWRMDPMHLVQTWVQTDDKCCWCGCAIGWPNGRGSGSAPGSVPATSGSPFGSPAAGGRWRFAPPTPPAGRSGAAGTADRWRPAPGQQQPPPPPPPQQHQRRQQPAAELAVQPLRSDDPWGGEDVPPPAADASARPALQRGALQAALESVAVRQQPSRPQHAVPPPPPPPAAQHQRQQQQNAELARLLGPDVARVAGLLPPQRQQPAHDPAAQKAAGQAPKSLQLQSARQLHQPKVHHQARGRSPTQQVGWLSQPHDREQPKPRHLSVPGGATEQQHQQLPEAQPQAGPAVMGGANLRVQPHLRAAQTAALLAEVSLGSRAASARGAPGSISGAQAGADLLRLVQRKPSGGSTYTRGGSPSSTGSPAAAAAASAVETGADAAAAHTLTGPRTVTRRQLRAQAYRAGTHKAGPGLGAALPLQPGSHPSSSGMAATPAAPAPQQRRNQQTSGPPGPGSSAHISGHAPRSSPQPATPVLNVRCGSRGMLEIFARSPTAAAAAPAPVAKRPGGASGSVTAVARTHGDGKEPYVQKLGKR
jgi:hypothetical protein